VFCELDTVIGAFLRSLARLWLIGVARLWPSGSVVIAYHLTSISRFRRGLGFGVGPIASPVLDPPGSGLALGAVAGPFPIRV
jgi:hypothetical protein